MKAIQVQKTGGPEVLTLVDLPVPKPKANEAVVKIAASASTLLMFTFAKADIPPRCRLSMDRKPREQSRKWAAM